ncbi:MAG: bifunctional histidinol-phosphatase/imidazoleglycerol-phosphate dehydratase HisB [Proteobacteria bacterium]|nr:bifunctional histidinol-phosphatase/imidazoleglycerol-phosphate dehydratase HisB [Pseudomonadota bacterium]
MSTPTLFIDRDGTLVEEPPNCQIDTLEKIRFMPGAFPALLELSRKGFKLVMVSNQDGLGTLEYPKRQFELCQAFILEAFASQGIEFQAVFVCPHMEKDGCPCRKPKTGLLDAYLREHPVDLERSAVIGDRETDLQLAQALNLPGIRVSRNGSPGHSWANVVKALTARQASVTRNTLETQVEVRVNLDRTEKGSSSTGIGFFDHMLDALAWHAGFWMELKTVGDLHVDEHHTVEDTALALGECLRRALGAKHGLARFGFVLPMDEAEAAVALDLSARPYFEFRGVFPRDKVGQFPSELVAHFFRSFSESLGATLHVSVRGENTHHMIEACFKAVGRALRQAFRVDGTTVPSTKGAL